MEYFSALKNNKKKKNEILSYATSVVHLEDIMLSEMNQSIKDKYCMILLIQGI